MTEFSYLSEQKKVIKKNILKCKSKMKIPAYSSKPSITVCTR